MNEGRTVFAQLLDFLPEYVFDKCVAHYCGNFRVRKLRVYEHFLVLTIAQLTWRESLRDIETCLASFVPRLYHAGNAVRTQGWTAIVVYLLVAILKKRLHLNASLYTMLHILNLTLFAKTSISQALSQLPLPSPSPDAVNHQCLLVF